MGTHLIKTLAPLSMAFFVVLLTGCSTSKPIDQFEDFKGHSITTMSEDVYFDVYGNPVTNDHLIFRNGNPYVAEYRDGFFIETTILEDFIATPTCGLDDLKPEWRTFYIDRGIPIHPVACLVTHIAKASGEDTDLAVVGYQPALNDYAQCYLDQGSLPWCEVSEQQFVVDESMPPVVPPPGTPPTFP